MLKSCFKNNTHFFDVVVWGHEHEQKIDPTKNLIGNFDVIQPGSSITITLIPEESTEKKIGILEVYKNKYEFSPINLKTVRKFFYEEISLSNFPELNNEKTNVEKISEILTNKIENILDDYKKTLENNDDFNEIKKKYPNSKYNLPLIRLKVDYSDGMLLLIHKDLDKNLLIKLQTQVIF
jgi:double-strand break repair protein MRE11